MLVTTLYALIFALGSAGNALSVHVVLKARAGRPGRLRYHVLILALSALLLLLLVSVPMELYNLVWFHDPWVLGDLGCRAYYFVRDHGAQRGHPERRALPGRVPTPVLPPPAVSAPDPPPAVAGLGRLARTRPAHGNHHGAEARA